MSPQTATVNPAKTIRMIHAAMAVGVLGFAGVTFLPAVASQAKSPASLGYALAAVALTLLAVGMGVLRRSVPRRSSDQTSDAFWANQDAVKRAMVLWATLESAGIASVVGRMVSANNAALAVGLLAVLLLYLVRPAALEGR